MAHRNRWFTVLKNGWIFHGSAKLPEGIFRICHGPMVRILRRCFQLLSLRDISGTTGTTGTTHSLLPQRRRGTLGRGAERRGDVADLGPLQSDGEGAIFLGMEMAGGVGNPGVYCHEKR